MLLKQINKAYWYIGILLYIVFAYKHLETSEQIYMYLNSLVTFLLFGIIILDIFRKEASFFTKKNLVFVVFIASFIQVIMLSSLSYSIDGDLFLFSKADAMLYYTESLKMSKMDLQESLNYISELFSFDDWGAFIWFSTILRIFPSLIFVKLIHIIVGAWISVLLFDIGNHFMPRRYAYMSALTFSIASFAVTHHTIFTKTTIFVFLIVAAFHFFYRYWESQKIIHLIMTFLLTASTAFFRLPVTLLLIFSFGTALIILYLRGAAAVILGVFLSALMLTSSYFSLTYERYLRSGNVELMMQRKEELSKGGGMVNHIADPLAALIGPFPSVVVTKKKVTPLFASGLLYRVLLAAPFFLGVYYVFRFKHKKLYPLVIFFLINALGVAISVKGLEFRLTHPHLAMAYIIAFWWLAQYDYKQIQLKLPPNIIYTWFIVVFALSFIWNLR